MNVWTGRWHIGVCEPRLDARTWLLLDQRARVGRRAMTMEYIFFVISIAAVGLLIILFWQIGVSSRKNSGSLSARQHNVSASTELAPPFKKSISGLSAKELERIEFQEKVDIWQRGHQASTNRTAEPLSGTKYTFVPQQKSHVAPQKTAQQKISTPSNRHKWQLIG